MTPDNPSKDPPGFANLGRASSCAAIFTHSPLGGWRAFLQITFRCAATYWAQLLAALITIAASWVAIRYAEQPLLEAHGFRQTQTALTSYWMVKEGWQLAYQTPVAGYPWAIPFEFPIYQALAALIARAGGFPLDPVGRLLSFGFLLACAWPAFGMARRLAYPQKVAWIFCALLWSSPLYLFWGRTFMIETAAFFFTFAAIPYAVDLREHTPKWTSALAFSVFATLGMLQKITTGAPVIAVMILFLIGAHVRTRDIRMPSSRKLACLALAFVPPLLLGYQWNNYADAVKSQNAFGALLTSKNLTTWNFGTMAQRLDINVWRTIIWDRVLLNNAAGVLGVVLIAAALLWGARRTVIPMLLCIALFLLPVAIFTNLHFVHDYYQVSCTAFLTAALAIACVYVSRDVRLTPSPAPILTLLLVVANLCRFWEGYATNVRMKLDAGNTPALAVSDVIRRHTPAKSAIVVFGGEWNSETAYYSQRKSFTVPHWFRTGNTGYDDVWKDPAAFVGGDTLGAVVYYMPGGASNVVDIARKPEIVKTPHLFKVDNAYVWIPSATVITLPGTGRVVPPMDFISIPSLALPRDYARGSPVHSDGSLDTLNGAPPTSEGTIIDTQLRVEGWCAVSADDGLLPDAVFVTFTATNSTILYAKAQRKPRPDVEAHFKQPAMLHAGFEAIIDVSMLQGDYVLGLARGYQGKLEPCSQFSIPIRVVRSN